MNELQTAKLLERIDRLEEKIKTLEDYQTYRRHFLSLNDSEVIFKTKGGGARLIMKNDGSVLLHGRDIEIKADGKVNIKGERVQEN